MRQHGPLRPNGRPVSVHRRAYGAWVKLVDLLPKISEIYGSYSALRCFVVGRLDRRDAIR